MCVHVRVKWRNRQILQCSPCRAPHHNSQTWWVNLAQSGGKDFYLGPTGDVFEAAKNLGQSFSRLAQAEAVTWRRLGQLDGCMVIPTGPCGRPVWTPRTLWFPSSTGPWVKKKHPKDLQVTETRARSEQVRRVSSTSASTWYLKKVTRNNFLLQLQEVLKLLCHLKSSSKR